MSDPIATFHKAARANSFWRFLGIEVEEAEEGRVRLRLQVRNEILNAPGGRVHGGIYPALIDAAVGGALMTTASASVGQATVDTDDDGELVAVGRATYVFTTTTGE